MQDISGLTDKQVKERIKNGKVNKIKRRYTKSVGRIIFDNLFTYFNILTVALFIIILCAGSLKNALFIGVVISNAFTGIMQEIKSKQLVDKLSIITANKAEAVRDGKKVSIAVDEIVEDDILTVKAGDQISVDAEVLISDGLEMDESLLTGEGVAVPKNAGDTLLSGSFVLAGSGTVRAAKIGAESYASSLAAEAKKQKKAYSEVIGTISRIIRYMSYLIVPVGIMLFISQSRGTDVELNDAVIGTVGAVIGMIPSGLVLISTVTMALGVLRCAQHNALVQEAAAIEALARVDTLCIDKTGTLTDGSVELYKIIPLGGTEGEIKKVFSEVFSAFEHKNSTAAAIISALGQSQEYRAVSKIPFSSERKWCGVCFEGRGSYIAGAPEYILGNTEDCKQYLSEGYRVIALAHSSEELDGILPGNLIPVAFAVLSDRIREDASKVLRSFAENDVRVKVISGDNPITVSNISARLGLENAEKYVDMSQYGEDDPRIDEIADKYEVFGRVTPGQKKNIVSALKKSGKTVAMTGDGVNDVLAMREADCSVAMASGSDAAKGVAKIVLVNSDFSPLVNVVNEGRRVVNNLEEVASLYLTKTLFSLMLSVFFMFFGGKYPLEPIYLTLIGMAAIGIPSFLLAMENNTERIKEGFKRRILRKSLPGSITISACIIGLAFAEKMGIVDEASYILQSVWITGFISLTVLCGVARPINRFRGAVVLAMTIMLVGGMVLFGGFMGLPAAKGIDYIIMPILSAAGFAVTLCTMSTGDLKRKDRDYGK